MENGSPVISFIDFGDGKVNALSIQVRRKLRDDVVQALKDPRVQAIVLVGKGSKNFSAGADIREFGHESKNSEDDELATNEHPAYTSKQPSIVDVCHVISHSTKPVVAAIRGACLGGGLEVALSCDFRVCCARTSTLGLPETQIGLIPGAGGTQRLPRLVGVGLSLDMIISGRSLKAQKALHVSLVDAIVKSDESLESVARQWAEWACALGRDAIEQSRKLHLRQVPGSIVENRKLCVVFATKLPSKQRGGLAVQAAVKAIRGSFDLPTFDDGCQEEEDLFWDLLLTSQQGRALRHAFFSQRSVQNPFPGNSQTSSLTMKEIKTVGVIGAGTMGQGIAISFLKVGFFVVLVDVNPEGLQRGVKAIELVLQKGPRKVTSISKVLQSSTDLAALAKCQVVVEAVFEKLELKQSIFQKLDSIVLNPKALLLTNTSTLDVQQIMKLVPSRSRLPNTAGMHFFSPAHIMKLVELVYVPSQTSVDTIHLMQALVKRIGKIGVVVANGPTVPLTPSIERVDGFVGNRMVFPYSSEAVLLMMEHPRVYPKDIDGALEEFGMAIGPLKMADLAGNDIGYLIRKAKGLVDIAKQNPNLRYPYLADELVTDLKRVGQKSLKGWYDYDPKIGKGRKALPSTDVEQFIDNARPSNSARTKVSNEQIRQRLLYPLVNEGFKILEEGVAQKPSDIDIIYLFGYGFPAWRGGPMFWADQEVGLPKLLQTLEQFHKLHPNSYYFRPSQLLRQCVAQGVTVHDYFEQKTKTSLKGTNKSKL